MSSMIRHRNVNIITLGDGDAIAKHCQPGDIALERDGQGWWTRFIGADGAVDSYDEPFDSYNKALWAAKAAAEFGLE